MYLKTYKTLPMQNLYDKNNSSNPAILVTAFIEEPDILQILVEKLAEYNYGIDNSLKQIPSDCQRIEISSIEAMVSGRMIMSSEDGLTEIPFVTAFLFTCTKSAKNQHNVT